MTTSTDRTWLIYLATNKLNDKVYVGQTWRTISKRWGAHLCGSRKPGRKAHFHVALAKYGAEAFTVEIIAQARTQTEANQLEVHWISHFDSANGAYGYNMTLGGDGGVVTEESRQRLVKATTSRWKNPEWRARQVSLLKARLSDPETRAKISASLTGKKASLAAKANLSKAAQARCADPGWQERNLEMRRLPEFRAKLMSAINRRKADLSLFDDLKKAIAKRWIAPGARAKQSRITIAQMSDPRARKRVSEALTGIVRSAETCAKMSAATIVQMADPARRAEMVNITTRLWNDPAYRARQMESRARRWANVTPEWKVSHRAATIAGMKRKQEEARSCFGPPDAEHDPSVLEHYRPRQANHPKEVEGQGLVQIGGGE